MGIFKRVERFLFLGFMVLATGDLRGQTTNNAMAGVSGAWLNLINSARIEGMGEAYTAVTGNIDSFAVNPGSLGKLSESQLAFTHNIWIQGASIDQFMASLRLGRTAGSLAFDFTFGNFGFVDKFDIVGGAPVQTGAFQPLTWMASCGYGVDLLDGLSLGFSGKFLMDDLDGDQKIGGAGDVGAACSFYGTGLTLGCSVLNLGSMSGATLPIEGRIGASYLIAFLDSGFIMSSNVRNKFLISVDGTAPFQDLNAAQASIGGEFWYHDIVALRLGQQLVRTPGLTGLSGFSAGVGVRDGPVQLDYAFATRGDLGNINMVSLLVKL